MEILYVRARDDGGWHAYIEDESLYESESLLSLSLNFEGLSVRRRESRVEKQKGGVTGLRRLVALLWCRSRLYRERR